jgi:hypothetical protein
VFTVGTHARVNTSGQTYVAYLFAHNDGDGEFGGEADADIIKCGSYTGNGSTDGPEIDLGFEPQFVILKRSSGTEDWLMFDNMRGMVVGGIDPDLRPNQSQLEGAFLNYLEPNATGFKLIDPNNRSNGSGDTYIYIAIRRGPLAEPESATEVFAIDASPNSSFPVYESGFPVDLGIRRYDYPSSGNSYFVGDRLRGANRLITNLTNAEASTTDVAFDSQDGWWTQPENSTSISWMWKRAPGYFDVVAYTASGNGTTISHNLGVEPELAIFKNRTTAGPDWVVHAPNLGTDGFLLLNSTNAVSTASNWYSATADQITFSTAYSGTATSGDNYIAYLFASLPGISKVGSFSHSNGSNTTVDCGFTSGARFVLVKQTDLADNWFVFDTERGLTVSDSPALFLNNANSESGASYIEPTSSGFIIKNGFWSAGDFIFYAIA